jgi:hypothetical protein
VKEVVWQPLPPGEVAEAGPEAVAEAAGAIGKSLVVIVKKKVKRKVWTEISEKVWLAAYSISLQIQNLHVINKCNQFCKKNFLLQMSSVFKSKYISRIGAKRIAMSL